MSWLSLTKAATILDHDVQRARESLERAISKAWIVGIGGTPAPPIDPNVPLRIQVTPSPGWRLVGRDWLDQPVLDWENSEIECLCAPWTPRGASQPAAPSQSRARIEIGRKTLRVYGVAPELQVASPRPLRPNSGWSAHSAAVASDSDPDSSACAGFAKCYQQTWAPEVQT